MERYECKELCGDDSPEAIGNLNDKILLQRIIAGVTYSINKTSVSFHVQDSRAFGRSLRENKYPDLFKIRKTGTELHFYIMNPQERYFEIYDLFIEHKNLFKNISVKTGHQNIFCGDYKIFGPGDWENTGRWT